MFCEFYVLVTNIKYGLIITDISWTDRSKGSNSVLPAWSDIYMFDGWDPELTTLKLEKGFASLWSVRKKCNGKPSLGHF